MKIEWERQQDGAQYTARWCGQTITLRRAGGRWQAVVDGAPCRQRWATLGAAMDGVAAAMDAAVARAVAGHWVAAAQRQPSTAHIARARAATADDADNHLRYWTARPDIGILSRVIGVRDHA